MSDRFPEQLLQAADNSGDPLPGAKLNFYITQTTTRKDTYSDDAKTIPNLNPVVANAAGRFGDIFMDTDVAYSVVYTDASDVVIQTFDPFDPVRATNVVETPVVTKSANFTALESERGSLYEIDASAGSINATLLAVADAGNNFEIGFKKVDSSANTVTVDANAAETIDGALDQVLAQQYDCIVLVCDGTQWHIKSDTRGLTENPLPPNYIDGLEASNNTLDAAHDIDIATGSARDADDASNIVLTSALTKQIDASWKAGTDQGGLASNLLVAADTDYYAHGITVLDADDVGFDTDPAAANLISQQLATAYRPILKIRTDSAADIIPNHFIRREKDGWRVDILKTLTGTNVDFEGLPDDLAWLELIISGLSTNGTSKPIIQLGESGAGLVTTGYLGTVMQSLTANSPIGENMSSGLFIATDTGGTWLASTVVHGNARISLLDRATDQWAMDSILGDSANIRTYHAAGSITLPGTVDRVRLTMANGTDAFDAGIVRLRGGYE